jgi:phage gp45-like
MDRLAERPQLAEYEVAVWHKEGHMIKLKANGAIEMQGTSLTVNMSGAVQINSATLRHNAKNVGDGHTHGGISPGGASTAPPN